MPNTFDGIASEDSLQDVSPEGRHKMRDLSPGARYVWGTVLWFLWLVPVAWVGLIARVLAQRQFGAGAAISAVGIALSLLLDTAAGWAGERMARAAQLNVRWWVVPPAIAIALKYATRLVTSRPTNVLTWLDAATWLAFIALGQWLSRMTSRPVGTDSATSASPRDPSNKGIEQNARR